MISWYPTKFNKYQEIILYVHDIYSLLFMKKFIMGLFSLDNKKLISIVLARYFIIPAFTTQIVSRFFLQYWARKILPGSWKNEKGTAGG